MCRNVFAIQKTLSDITNHPEQDMDHARQFYDLFTLSPEVSINESFLLKLFKKIITNLFFPFRTLLTESWRKVHNSKNWNI